MASRVDGFAIIGILPEKMKSTIVHYSLIPFVSLLFFILFSCNYSEMSEHQQEILAFQNELNEQFADSEHSPLVPKDLETFESLEFFPVDNKYRVEYVYCEKTKLFTIYQ